jgi:hypothetical protein
MSKRLQVLLADDEMADIQTLAKREQLTVGEWVRRTLREARKQKSVRDPAAKLAAIRRVGIQLSQGYRSNAAGN